MPIPENQLDTWSHQGSITQSRDTYQTVRQALEAAGAGYSNKRTEIFLQGSYCNDTNIYAESDVDVVMRLQSVFFHDLSRLEPPAQEAFKNAHSDATYKYAQYKADVVAHLKNSFGTSVAIGNNAVKVSPAGGRRSTDVVVATQFRRYHKFVNLSDQQYDEGICFFAGDGVRIENYPKQHSANCTTKHQQTNSRFKPMVRIFKNMRSKLEHDGLLAVGTAPSYFIEGLLFNVPNELFVAGYASTFENCYQWLLTADREKLVCANWQFWLLRGDPRVTWTEAKCDQFLNAAGTLWRKW